MKSGACPCGNPLGFDACCGRYLDQSQRAPTAEALMRSRYCAYALGREPYLLATWHPTTRPAALYLEAEAATGATRWIGLDLGRHELQDESHATVEFVARYRINGRAHRLHELSRFVRENGEWLYVDGDMKS